MKTPQTPSMNTTMGIHSNSARILVENCSSGGEGLPERAVCSDCCPVRPDEPRRGPDELLSLQMRSELRGLPARGMRRGLWIGSVECGLGSLSCGSWGKVTHLAACPAGSDASSGDCQGVDISVLHRIGPPTASSHTGMIAGKSSTSAAAETLPITNNDGIINHFHRFMLKLKKSQRHGQQMLAQ